jgi:hypothetical protein
MRQPNLLLSTKFYNLITYIDMEDAVPEFALRKVTFRFRCCVSDEGSKRQLTGPEGFQP